MYELKTTLFSYQEEAIEWMMQKENATTQMFYEENFPKGGILADEVGLGKTIMSLALILRNVKTKTLVLLPKSLICQWYSQINQFSDFPVQLIDNKYNVKDFHDYPCIYLMSHSMLNVKNTEVGTSIAHLTTWDRIFIDEAHVLRNKRSKINEACCLLKSDIKWALTATPVMNRMSDFVNIMEWIGISKYLCQYKKIEVTSEFIKRRTKQDLIEMNSSLQLPECIVENRFISFMNTDEANLYMKVFNQERKIIKTSSKHKITDLLEHLLRIRQLSIHPQLYLDGMSKKTGDHYGTWNTTSTKVEECLSYIKSTPAEDKVLIFCQFVKEIDIFSKALENIGYSSVRLDGTMSSQERQHAVEMFKSQSSIKTFIIQINTGGQGINLQCANHIIITSPNWNPAVEYQAIGRAHRTGQTKPVRVIKLCLSSGNSDIPLVEENILKLHERKKQIISNILGDMRIVNDGIIDKFGLNASSLTADEIKYIFNIHKMK